MPLKHDWRDQTWSRLRGLAPGEWMLVGELYDEVRADIPPHLARRHVLRKYQNARGNRVGHSYLPSPENAAWLYFVGSLRQMGIVRESCGEKRKGPGRGTRNIWGYRDKVRLATVEGAVCHKCGGPVIKARGVNPQTKGAVLYLCQGQCDRKPVMPKPEPEYETEVVPLGPGDPIPPAEDNPARTGEVERFPSIRRYMSQKLTPAPRPEVPRRNMAKLLRDVLPNGAALSINYLAAQLEQAHDSIETVLVRFGIGPEDKETVQNRHRIAVILRGQRKGNG